MKVEIWSDIACPFCYIGKAHFEKALASFSDADEVAVEYKSYILDPEMEFKEGQTAISYLTQRKGMAKEQVAQMKNHIEKMGADAGLKMNFRTNIPANTGDAHRLIHLAITQKKEKRVIEGLFAAHFTEGKNIQDKEILKAIGVKAGIDATRIEEVLGSDEYAYEVKQDLMDSRNFGVKGVPYFVFNQKYAVSGAQPVETFSGALEQSFNEWRKDNPKVVNLNTSKGAACTTDNCKI